MALLKLFQKVLNLVLSPANLGNCNFGNLGFIPDLNSILTSEMCSMEVTNLWRFLWYAPTILVNSEGLYIPLMSRIARKCQSNPKCTLVVVEIPG